MRYVFHRQEDRAVLAAILAWEAGTGEHLTHQAILRVLWDSRRMPAHVAEETLDRLANAGVLEVRP